MMSDSMTAEERLLLEMLAESADGCTDALLTARFKLDTLISVVSAEFAMVTPERNFAAGKSIEVTRVRITDVGGGRLLK